MNGAIAWVAFFGTWLLVAGPVFQASVELGEQHLERDRLEAVSKAVPREPAPSPWWWLLPPVMYLKSRRRNARFRSAVLTEMPHEDVRAFVAFLSKASGWMLVASGALLLAVEATWQLTEHNGWPLPVFFGLVVGMAALALLYTVVAVIRTRGVLAGHRPGRHESADRPA